MKGTGFRTGKTKAYVYASDFALSYDGESATVEVSGSENQFSIEFFESARTETGALRAVDFRSLAVIHLDDESLRFIVAKGADLLGLAVLEAAGSQVRVEENVTAPEGSRDDDDEVERVIRFASGEETVDDLAGKSPRSRGT